MRAEFEALRPNCPNAANLSSHGKVGKGKVMINLTRNGAEIFRWVYARSKTNVVAQADLVVLLSNDCIISYLR